MAQAIGVLGLAPELPIGEADRAAAALGVPVGDHRVARREITAQRNVRDRAAAVVHVLTRVEVDDGVFARLIGAGLVAEVWAEAGVWDVARRRLVFPAAGMRPTPLRSEAGRAPPKSPSRSVSRPP